MAEATKDQKWELKQQAYEASGLTAVAWCKANNEKLWTFKYWRQKLRPPSNSPLFEELTDQKKEDIEIRIGELTVHFSSGLESALIKQYLKILMELTC